MDFLLGVQTLHVSYGNKTISCVFPAPGSNGHMNEAAVTNQATLGCERYEQVVVEEEAEVDAVKREEKLGNSHTWKRFPEAHGFKRKTVESNNTLKR